MCSSVGRAQSKFLKLGTLTRPTGALTLSPYLNVGLLEPLTVVRTGEAAYNQKSVVFEWVYRCLRLGDVAKRQWHGAQR